MQRTILLAITLLALVTRFSWAQTPTAEPAATPPAPPEAIAADSQEIASESDKSAEIPPLMIEEPKADDPRVEEFRQIIQLLVNRNIARVVPPTDRGTSTESHTVIAFDFVRHTDRVAIRSLLYEISQIKIPKLQVTIRNQIEDPSKGRPPSQVHISNYESLERQHVVALWRLFKQHEVMAFFASGKQKHGYSVPPFPEPVFGAETTEQIQVEIGTAHNAFVSLQDILRRKGPPCSLGYDEKTNSLLVDRRDGVSNEVRKLLDQFYPKPKPAPPVAEITESPAPAAVEATVDAKPVRAQTLIEALRASGVSSEGALGLPASAIPGRVWVSSGTVIVAIADDGKSASAYCEQHPTWVAVQLDSTIEAKPVPIVGAKVATIQHGKQCHAYSPRHRAWATLTLSAGEEAVPSVGGFASTATVQSKTQGEYVFKDEWGKWFSAEEIKAGKVAEHLAALKAKGGQKDKPWASVTTIFPLKHSKATDTVDVLKQLYDPNAVKIAQDVRTNEIIVSAPSDLMQEIESLIQKLDETRPVAPSVSAAPNVNEMEALISNLEGQRTILLQDLGQGHPKIVAIDIQIELARKKMQPAKKAWLLEQMEQALSSLQQAAGVDATDVKDVESKITAIISEFDQSPDTTQKKGEAFIQQVEEQALAKNEDRMKQLLELVKAGAIQRSSPKIVEHEQRIAELRKRARARALGVGPVSPLASSPNGKGVDAPPAQAHHQYSPPLSNSPADLPQQIAQLRKDCDATEAQAQRLAEQLRQPGTKASKDELRKTVERAFKLRQSLLRAELSEMLDRLAKTQHSIDLRDRIAYQIVTRRVDELLNPQLEWDESKSGTQPETPTAPPKESAPTQPQEWTTKLHGHWQLMQHTYEQVDTSDGKKPQPGDVKRENWNPETYYRKQTTPWKAMFDGHQMSICKEDGSDPMTFELSFRKAGPPQQVDLTMVLNEEQIAEFKRNAEESQSPMEIPAFMSIIEETPDGFRMCLDLKMTGTRPFLFVLGPDTGLWEFRREAVAPSNQFQEQAAAQEFLPPAKGRSPEKNSNSSDIKAANPSQLTALQMTSLFNAILQRHPYEGEAEAWLSAVQKGQSTTDVTSTLLASNEVFQRLGRDKAAFVSYLHQTFLDRKPTEDELIHWTLRYDARQGIRSDLAREFIDSVGASTVIDLLNRRAASQKALAEIGSNTPRTASLQIPKGMRLNTFPLTDSQAHSGMLKVDDRVDVKVTFTTSKGTVEAKTLLEHVRVFAIEKKTSKGEDGRPVLRSRFVTLLVTPEQDGYIEIAKTKGQLSLSLRNPDDDELVNANGLNAQVLDELKHAIKPGESPPAATELEGDWHLLWMDSGRQKTRFAANMAIHGSQCLFSKQNTGSKTHITVDAEARTVLWSNIGAIHSMPIEVPPVPPGGRGNYELTGDRLTIRNPEGPISFVWTRGLCDLEAAKRIPNGMRFVHLRGVNSPSGLGQLNPGDQVDLTATWELPDGKQNTGVVAELAEIDELEYGEPEPKNGVALLCHPDQAKLVEAVWTRAKLSLIARKPGDEALKFPGGMNASVLTEIKAAAGADPVTPVEGDWYLESQEFNGDITGHRTNMTIRGDEWSKELMVGALEGTRKLSGRLKLNKHDHSYVISEWPKLSILPTQDDVRYYVDENGTFELTSDKLVMRSRETPGNAILTSTWKKGHRPFVPPLSPVSETRKLRWRSGIVEIFLGGNDSLGKRLDGVDRGDGMGLVVSPDGLIVGNSRNSAFYFANSDTHKLHAKFDDGSFVKLTVVEDAKNGWLAFKPEKEMRVNHFFPIATTPNAISDEVYAWGTNISGAEHFLDVFQSKILLMDRRLSGTSEPVWQLLKPDHWGRASGLPILSAEGELLALTMPDTGDLLLALPADRLKAMFPKSFSPPAEVPTAPAP